MSFFKSSILSSGEIFTEVRLEAPFMQHRSVISAIVYLVKVGPEFDVRGIIPGDEQDTGHGTTGHLKPRPIAYQCSPESSSFQTVISRQLLTQLTIFLLLVVP